MTLKDIELELIELRKEHEAMAEVVKHHVKNFDKLRNWHENIYQADVVVMKPIVTNYESKRFENGKQHQDSLDNLTKIITGMINKGLAPQIGWRIVDKYDVWIIEDIIYRQEEGTLEFEMTF